MVWAGEVRGAGCPGGGCAATRAFQSGVLSHRTSFACRSFTSLTALSCADAVRRIHAGHLAERRDEPAPVFALFRQDRAAGLGDAVVAAPALAGLLDPASLDPAAVLEAVERGVERREREAEVAAGALFDQLRDLVAVVRFVLDHREDHDFGAAFLGLVDRSALCHAGTLYAGQLYVKGGAHQEEATGVGGTTNIKNGETMSGSEAIKLLQVPTPKRRL